MTKIISNFSGESIRCNDFSAHEILESLLPFFETIREIQFEGGSRGNGGGGGGCGASHCAAVAAAACSRFIHADGYSFLVTAAPSPSLSSSAASLASSASGSLKRKSSAPLPSVVRVCPVWPSPCTNES